jgi:hypothetical protein
MRRIAMIVGTAALAIVLSQAFVEAVIAGSAVGKCCY